MEDSPGVLLQTTDGNMAFSSDSDKKLDKSSPLSKEEEDRVVSRHSIAQLRVEEYSEKIMCPFDELMFETDVRDFL